MPGGSLSKKVDIQQRKIEAHAVTLADQQRRGAAIEPLAQIGEFAAQASPRFRGLPLAPELVLKPAARSFAILSHRQHCEQSDAFLTGNCNALAVRLQ